MAGYLFVKNTPLAAEFIRRWFRQADELRLSDDERYELVSDQGTLLISLLQALQPQGWENCVKNVRGGGGGLKGVEH
jgi:hypothetical protein